MALPIRLLALSSLILGLLLAACSSSSSATPTASGGAFEQQFIDMMVPHHLSAVQMAQIAQRRAEHPEIKQVAQGIITGQDKEIQQLKQWRKQWYGSDAIPAATGGGQMGHGDGPAGTMGTEAELQQLEVVQPFDKTFIDMMVPHHESAILMAKEAQQKATRPEIKTMADAIIAAQQREIDQMKQWRQQWYGA